MKPGLIKLEIKKYHLSKSVYDEIIPLYKSLSVLPEYLKLIGRIFAISEGTQGWISRDFFDGA